MIIEEIIVKTIDKPWEIWSQLASILVAIGTAVGVIFSMWYSRKTLRHSEWNTNMSTAPSLTIECAGIQFWRSKQKDVGGSWSEPTNFLESSDEYITMELTFLILNKGRGVALGIEKPKITCDATSTIKQISIPVSMGHVSKDSANLKISITEKHPIWLSLMNGTVNFDIEIVYKNDQGNICCLSKWSAELRPFETENTRLKIRARGEKILNADMKIKYLSIIK